MENKSPLSKDLARLVSALVKYIDEADALARIDPFSDDSLQNASHTEGNDD